MNNNRKTCQIVTATIFALAFMASGVAGQHFTITSEARSELWVRSFETFLFDHPDLSAKQASAILDALDLGQPEFFSMNKDTTRWQKEQGTPMKKLLARISKLFSVNERGEIFSRMGAAQDWLVDTKMMDTGFCTCDNLGGACGPPNSECKCSTCITWEDASEKYLIGLCFPK